MNRNYCLFFVFVLLIGLLLSPITQALYAQSGTPVTATTRSDLNVRTEPNANAVVAGVLPANTTVEVLEQFTNTTGELWLRIPYEDGEGWIAGWLVTINEGVETAPETEYVDPSGWIFEAENGLSVGFRGRITDITIAPADWQTHLDQYEIAARSYAVATATIAFPNGQTLDVVVLIYNDNLRKTLIIGSQDLTSPFVAFANTEEALAENGIVPGAEVIIDLGQLPPDANFADWLNELAVESDVALSMVETGDLSAIRDLPFVVPVSISVTPGTQLENQIEQISGPFLERIPSGEIVLPCTIDQIVVAEGRGEQVKPGIDIYIPVYALCSYNTPDGRQIIQIALAIRDQRNGLSNQQHLTYGWEIGSGINTPAYIIARLGDVGIIQGLLVNVIIFDNNPGAYTERSRFIDDVISTTEAITSEQVEAFAASGNPGELNELIIPVWIDPIN